MTATRTVTIADPLGLHARPAAEFVSAARGYQSDLVIRVGDATANCKSLLSVLKLGIAHGTVVVVEADGEDEDSAVEDLAARLENEVQDAASS
ncbi:HPr family phosphocarrier protein [Nocardioides aquiterrae]|uniref:Phosphocarrier protein HPr n=1 Tax=Nocardioides aquiterrae TaxID=203799 RepID=A0ABN1UCC6_9ACTN